MLEEYGYQNDSALDGELALRKIKERITKFKEDGTAIYKIIFLDYSMPEMDGPMVVQEIHKILADYSDIEIPYICCVTAYAEASFKARAIESGMDYYITKPVSNIELVKICTNLETFATLEK